MNLPGDDPDRTELLGTRAADAAGADAVVLFNRFLQPTIDVQDQAIVNEMVLSHEHELRLPLRWIALLYGRTKLDLVMNTGVVNGQDALKGLLAGATAVQVASTLFRNGLPYLSTMLLDIQNWMGENGYESLDQFRGAVSQQNVNDPFGFERAQYMELLLSQQ